MGDDAQMVQVRVAQAEAEQLSPAERHDLLHALRGPRGRYIAARAAQLSGVPERTVYHWATQKILVPDFASQRPKNWSYRDLVYLRLLVFLRSHGVDLDEAAALTSRLKDEFSDPTRNVDTVVSSAAGGFALGPGMVEDQLTGQRAFDTMAAYVGTFDLLAPLESRSPRQVWGPNLVRPSRRTAISPWVLSGEPVVRDSRIPTATLYALATARGLRPTDIAELYPVLDEEAVDDALGLETRLRAAAA
jgi:uncharacterized protein (DUF433 family)/DNA-binding transcriptional MerR regulator